MIIINYHAVIVVMGCHEKLGKTLYNSMLFFDGHKDKLCVHRKLMPTYNEKMIWGAGDGSTLTGLEADFGNIGGLICWEHWMPLARAAMQAGNEMVHIAQWPSVIELHQIASRSYAFEGNCFVLAAGTVLTARDMFDGFDSLQVDEPAARQMLESIPLSLNDYLMSGGSCIIRPDAGFLAEPVFEEKKNIFGNIDFQAITEAALVMDTSGHYSRPDIFSLTVDTSSRANVSFKYEQR